MYSIVVSSLYRQAVLIAFMVWVKALPNEWKKYDVEDVSEGLQNFVICVEMLLFAIAHYFVFSHKPYIDPAAAQAPCIASCLRMLDVRDVADDMKEHFVDPIPRPKLPNITRRRKSKQDERAPLLSEAAPGPSINADVESEEPESDSKQTPSSVPRLGVESSSEFSLLTYKDLDPKAPFGRMSAAGTVQRSRSSSSQGTTNSTGSEGDDGITVNTQ